VRIPSRRRYQMSTAVGAAAVWVHSYAEQLLHGRNVASHARRRQGVGTRAAAGGIIYSEGVGDACFEQVRHIDR
jgi:hypothetical protein